MKGKPCSSVGRGRFFLGHGSVPVFLHVVYSCERVIFVYMQTMLSKSGSGRVMGIILGYLLLNSLLYYSVKIIGITYVFCKLLYCCLCSVKQPSQHSALTIFV